MEGGYSFFSQWLDSLLENGKFIRFWLTFIHDFSLLHSLSLSLSSLSLSLSLSLLSSLHESEYSVTDPTSNVFLSQQTWDLMGITWYGFKEFCKYLIQQHPGYAVFPLRLNGSAVETIFSCLKFIPGGHLSAVNFVTARANLITRYGVHG